MGMWLLVIRNEATGQELGVRFEFTNRSSICNQCLHFQNAFSSACCISPSRLLCLLYKGAVSLAVFVVYKVLVVYVQWRWEALARTAPAQTVTVHSTLLSLYPSLTLCIPLPPLPLPPLPFPFPLQSPPVPPPLLSPLFLSFSSCPLLYSPSPSPLSSFLSFHPSSSLPFPFPLRTKITTHPSSLHLFPLPHSLSSLTSTN